MTPIFMLTEFDNAVGWRTDDFVILSRGYAAEGGGVSRGASAGSADVDESAAIHAERLRRKISGSFRAAPGLPAAAVSPLSGAEIESGVKYVRRLRELTAWA
jgi:hypothetical protein